MKFDIKMLELAVGVIDKITSKNVNKDKIEETIKLGSKSRTMWFNTGLIVMGALGAFTPVIKEHLSVENFSMFLSVVGMLGGYFRVTTVTPKGSLGRTETVGIDNPQNNVSELKL